MINGSVNACIRWVGANSRGDRRGTPALSTCRRYHAHSTASQRTCRTYDRTRHDGRHIALCAAQTFPTMAQSKFVRSVALPARTIENNRAICLSSIRRRPARLYRDRVRTAGSHTRRGDAHEAFRARPGTRSIRLANHRVHHETARWTPHGGNPPAIADTRCWVEMWKT